MNDGLKTAVIFVALVAVIVAAGGSYYAKVSREKMRTEVAQSCIEHGGKYHETMFRRRPVCKGVLKDE